VNEDFYEPGCITDMIACYSLPGTLSKVKWKGTLQGSVRYSAFAHVSDINYNKFYFHLIKSVIFATLK
jgi:hypothetical protein